MVGLLKEDKMSESKRFKKAAQIARKLINEENATDALTIMTMAASFVLRSLPPEDFEPTYDLHVKLLKMAPPKLPEGFFKEETTH